MENSKQYEKFGDYELIYLYLQGNEDAFSYLVDRYQEVFSSLLNHNYCNLIYLFSEEDLIQEAMLVFYDLVYSYCSCSDASFRTFAMTCVGKRWMSYYRQAKMERRRANLDTISLERPIMNTQYQVTELNLKNSIPDENSMRHPEKRMRIYEKMNEVSSLIKESNMSYASDVARLKMLGYKEKEIAHELEISEKKVANTIYRIRKKIDFNEH